MCFACGTKFRRKYNMYRHMESCTGEKPLPPPLDPKVPCSSCGRVLSDKYKLARHMRVCTGKTQAPPPWPPTCTKCTKTFNTRYNLARHLDTCKGPREEIPDTPESRQCPACNIVLSRKHYFKIHVAKCEGPRTKPTGPPTCTHCKETFTQMGSLTRHLGTCDAANGRGPKPERAWKCPYAKEGMRCVHYTFDDNIGLLASHFRVEHRDMFTDVEDGMPRVNHTVALAKAHLAIFE